MCTHPATRVTLLYAEDCMDSKIRRLYRAGKELSAICICCCSVVDLCWRCSFNYCDRTVHGFGPSWKRSIIGELEREVWRGG